MTELIPQSIQALEEISLQAVNDQEAHLKTISHKDPSTFYNNERFTLFGQKTNEESLTANGRISAIRRANPLINTQIDSDEKWATVLQNEEKKDHLRRLGRK